MSVINKITGYRGFTICGMGNSYGVDANGKVKNCMVSIRFPMHVTNVSMTISTGANDWAAKMGDGSIIPLSNPVILYQNKDSAVVLFDMSTAYAANSPMFLVYRSDTAKLTITDVNTTMPYVNNMASGIFAMTVSNGAATTPHADGYVNKLVATLQFPYQVSDVDFEISKGTDDWKVKMGDGSIITLGNPTVLSLNKDNAVVQFTMATTYPSNSPGILLYGANTAYYKVTPKNGASVYTAVKDITGLPSSIYVAEEINLNAVTITPYNASYTTIKWTVVSGSATITGSTLKATNSGSIVIKATIDNGSAVGTAYTKTFALTAVKNVLTILAQPVDSDVISQGTTLTLDTLAKSSLGLPITYQWYHNTSASTSGATKISGATSNSYTIPASTTAGSHYYYCVISSTGGATSVTTNISAIQVNVKLTGITISPRSLTIVQRTAGQLSVSPSPSTASIDDIVWSSNSPDVATVSSSGLVTGIDVGTAVITAKTLDGSFSDSISITISAYIPVTNITGISTDIVTDKTITLNPTVVPSNANSKTISWSIVDNNANAVLNGNSLVAKNAGTFILRATITNGAAIDTDYIQDFNFNVSLKFIPVTSISLSNSLVDQYEVGDDIMLDGSVTPSNASVRDITWSLLTNNCQLIDNKLTIVSVGNITIRGTVTNGAGTEDNRIDYVEDFTFTDIVDKFVPVSGVSITFNHSDGSSDIYLDPNEYDDSVLEIEMPISIFPDNATHSDFTATVTELLVGKKDPDNYSIDSVADWSVPEDGIIVYDSDTNIATIDTNKLGIEVLYKMNLHVVIKNGASKTTDYVADLTVVIKGITGDRFVPLRDLEIQFPSKIRCFYPTLVTLYTTTPVYCTGKLDSTNLYPSSQVNYGVSSNTDDIDEDQRCIASLMSPVNGDLFFHTVEPLPIFQWNWAQLYCYPWSPGYFHLYISVLGATVADLDNYDPYEPELVNFTKSWLIEVLPPFIAVKNITNIPSTINAKQEVILSPEIDTEGGLDCYNPYWDETEATYQEIEWSIISNSAGATIDDGRLSATKAGTVKLRATIASGTQEYLFWYNPVPANEQIDYTQDFTIKVLAAETKSTTPIAVLTLTTGSTVDVCSKEDFANLCTNAAATSSITIGSTTFTKDQIKSVVFKFSNENIVPVTDLTINSAGTSATVVPSSATNKTVTVSAPDAIESIGDSSHVCRFYKFTVANGCGSGGQDFVKYGMVAVGGWTTWDSWNLIGGINVGQIKYRVDPGTTIEIPITLVGNEMEDYDYRYKNVSVSTNQNSSYISSAIYSSNSKTLTVKLADSIPIGTICSCILSAPLENFCKEGEKFYAVEDDGTYSEKFVYYGNFSLCGGTRWLFAWAEDITSFDGTITFTLPYPPGTNQSTVFEVGLFRNDYIIYNGQYEPHGLVYYTEDGYSGLITYTNDTSDIVIQFKTSDIPNEYAELNELFPNGFALRKVSGYSEGEQITAEIEFEIIDPLENNSGITSLKDFGRNFTNLTSINGIPAGITGESCLENFLRGCTSFNQALTVPDGCTGDKALKYFLRDCTSFNSKVTLPTGLTGESVLYGFLYGCTKFNQAITIPTSVTGKQCLERFLYGCSVFNKVVTIPTGVAGYACLRDFLTECTSFNQNITLPNDVGSYGPMIDSSTGANCGRELCNIMKNCHSMCSTVTVPALTAQNCQISEQAFSSTRISSKLATSGITIAGAGLNSMLTKLSNSYDTGTYPYTHFTNLDT